LYSATVSQQSMSKLRCLLQYFFECYEIFSPKLENPGISHAAMNVEFIRCVKPTCLPELEASQLPLVPIDVRKEGSIQDAAGILQADFANRFLGGGVLRRGCVQEEISFVVSPELLVSRLISEHLTDHEAMIINGAAQFSAYSGYASSFNFEGRVPEQIISEVEDRNCIRNVSVIAFDAVDFSPNPVDQYDPRWVHREIDKAYAAFAESALSSLKAINAGPIATGNWGCGAFKGNLELKLIIQWLVASYVRRPLVYFTFGNADFCDRIKQFVSNLPTWVQCRDLYKALITCCTEIADRSMRSYESVDRGEVGGDESVDKFLAFEMSKMSDAPIFERVLQLLMEEHNCCETSKKI
jgi:poly(ADP-ribose) glycohydrolase